MTASLVPWISSSEAIRAVLLAFFGNPAGVTPLGRPRALTATGGGCEGSMELRKAAGEWLWPKRAAGEAQWEAGAELGSGGGGGGNGNTSGTGKAVVGLKTGGGGGGGDGEEGLHGASASVPKGCAKGGAGARPKCFGVGDMGDGRLEELGLEAGVPWLDAGPRF